MPWHVAHLDQHGIIEIRFDGVLTRAELDAAVGSGMAEAMRHSCPRILADCSTLEGGHSMIDLYGWVEKVQPAVLGLRFKEAVVVPANAQADAGKAEFWRTAAGNRGIEVELFANRADALSWLLA